MHHALIKIALKKRKSMLSFAQGEKRRKKLLLTGPALASRACRGIAACNLGVNASGSEAESLNGLGQVSCTCVCRGCVSAVYLLPAKGFGLPGPQPSGSSGASSPSLNSVAIARGCKTHREFLIFERPRREGNYIDK